MLVRRERSVECQDNMPIRPVTESKRQNDKLRSVDKLHAAWGPWCVSVPVALSCRRLVIAPRRPALCPVS